MEQSETLKIENRIQAILTLDMDNIPSNFQEILKQEQEVVAKWKDEGILENLFLRQGRNGAILIFKGLEEEKVKELMMILPFYKLKKSIEYFNLIKQF
jgi:muconolactone D-isomerase